MRVILPAILLALSVPAFGEADGVTWTYTEYGYTITHRATSPLPVYGQTLVLQGETRWVDRWWQTAGVITEEALAFTIQPEVRAKEWQYVIPEQMNVIIDSGAGDGGIEMASGRLRVWVNTPNDGVQHMFRWRMVLKEKTLNPQPTPTAEESNERTPDGAGSEPASAVPD